MALGLAPAVIPIATLLFKGLDRVKEREILNNVRVAAGQPFDPKAIRNDVSTLYRLGQFGTIQASATVLPDGSVELTYTFLEQPIVKDLQVVGNKLISDQELRKAIPLYAGGPRDDFLLEQAVARIWHSDSAHRRRSARQGEGNRVHRQRHADEQGTRR